jgi:hypothetical protein
VNSKQFVAAISAVILVAILAYPALATGTISIILSSAKIQEADHVYATVENVWVHHAGQPGSSGWELVSNQSQTVDLVTLQNSEMMFAKGQVSVGSYDSVRMNISNVTWVFNKTTDKLTIELSQLQSKLEFTAQAGKESAITLILSARQEQISGTKVFVSDLNATLAGVPTSDQS